MWEHIHQSKQNLLKQQTDNKAHKTLENANSASRFLFLSYTFTFVHNLF